MEGTLKIGDVVQLKSGGPKMTVVDLLSGTTHVTCMWFADTAVKTEIFAILALDRA
jgi:uncharacterized protein YodC (DUF2158 family)